MKDQDWLLTWASSETCLTDVRATNRAGKGDNREGGILLLPVQVIRLPLCERESLAEQNSTGITTIAAIMFPVYTYKYKALYIDIWLRGKMGRKDLVP